MGFCPPRCGYHRLARVKLQLTAGFSAAATGTSSECPPNAGSETTRDFTGHLCRLKSRKVEMCQLVQALSLAQFDLPGCYLGQSRPTSERADSMLLDRCLKN